MTYLEECNKYFSPLDEIAEAIRNNEGVSGVSNQELLVLCVNNDELSNDLYEECDLELADYI